MTITNLKAQPFNLIVMRRIIPLLILLLPLFATAKKVTDSELDIQYQRTERKALRFRDDAEWLNASAMFTLMIDARPYVASNYANAVIANTMSGDTAAVVRIMELGMTNNVPMDTIFADVQRISTRLGISYLYEDLLINSAQHFPWLQRSLNSYLLKYYTFRNNGPQMVRYARIMLAGMPDSIDFQRILAKGYMLSNNMADAITVWRQILADHPDNLDTLLDLGNYYITIGAMAKAKPYLDLAYRLHPTPYLKNLLAENKPSND